MISFGTGVCESDNLLVSNSDNILSVMGVAVGGFFPTIWNQELCYAKLLVVKTEQHFLGTCWK